MDQRSNVLAGLPPSAVMDSYNSRAARLGSLKNTSHIFFSPSGQMFVVRGAELYRGTLPDPKQKDWYSLATRVGKTDWGNFKFLFFHPNGFLCAVTNQGQFYKGPAPSNENRSWLYGQATCIGNKQWNRFDALTFDAAGLMYGVLEDTAYIRYSLPSNPNDDLLKNMQVMGRGGWNVLSFLFQVTLNPRYLWTVNRSNGNMYKGPLPDANNASYLARAIYLGYDYHVYKYLMFTVDKTIHSILSFEFLPELGKTISQDLEVVEDKIYDNRRSSSTLRHTFEINKNIKQSSSFTHEHGFSVEFGVEITVKTGVPFIAEGGLQTSVNMSTTHNWSFNETNETEISFTSSTNVELEPKQAIRIIASVMRATVNIPYRARICTLFGYETTIEGTWKGACHYNLMVTQEDYTK
ncbi:uncharacterized protein RCH25_053304 [Pelodytes ibericus]